MTKRTLLIAGIIGLVAAAVAAFLINRAPFDLTIDSVALVLDLIAGGIAGRVILGGRPVHRYFTLGVVLLSAISAAILTSATTSYLISQVPLLGPVSRTPTVTAVASCIIGLVVYILAAIVFGLAGKRQKVSARGRVGLLLLLLVAVVPVLNVLGLIGAIVVTIVSAKPDAGAATPAPPAASE